MHRRRSDNCRFSFDAPFSSSLRLDAEKVRPDFFATPSDATGANFSHHPASGLRGSRTLAATVTPAYRRGPPLGPGLIVAAAPWPAVRDRPRAPAERERRRREQIRRALKLETVYPTV